MTTYCSSSSVFMTNKTDQLKYSPPIAKKVGVVTEVMWPQARWVGVVTEVMCTYVSLSAACARKFGGKIKFTGNSL